MICAFCGEELNEFQTYHKPSDCIGLLRHRNDQLKDEIARLRQALDALLPRGGMTD